MHHLYLNQISFKIQYTTIGVVKINRRKCLPLKLENKIKGKIVIVKTTEFVEKLPINENICIKYKLDDSIIEGINHGKPVNIVALIYSNKDKKTIIYIIENFFF